MRPTAVIVAHGERFGMLTVVKPLVSPRPVGKYGRQAIVRCDCGVTKMVNARGLPGKKSCGCIVGQPNRSADRPAEPHGMGSSSEYRIWAGMIQRCTNPKRRAYRHYGGRGITVCERWAQSFSAFFTDMGSRPSPRHTIDRINNDGNYEPGNVRWATRKEQTRNTRSTRYLVFRGETLALVEWAERLGVPVSSISSRLSKGWSVERALAEPVKRSA